MKKFSVTITHIQRKTSYKEVYAQNAKDAKEIAEMMFAKDQAGLNPVSRTEIENIKITDNSVKP